MAGMGGTEKPAKLKKYGYQEGKSPTERYWAARQGERPKSLPEDYPTGNKPKEVSGQPVLEAPKLGRAREAAIDRYVKEASE